MSKRKYKITVTSFDELAKAFPLAVKETVTPAQTVRKEDYVYISGLLDRKIPVPGVEVTDQKIAHPVKDDIQEILPDFTRHKGK